MLVKKFGPSPAVEVQIGADVCLPPEVQVTYYRIAQEALNNIVKHAGSRGAAIQFDGLEGQAMLTTSDQGEGAGFTFQVRRRVVERMPLVASGSRLKSVSFVTVKLRFFIKRLH
ncbi:hypothetical protein AIOL_004631 [Candidatus Rhodobacter oscarellae]|uniref:histidine kinase n=1 Tax=Candidatus Rhodobacter oscarellae TaxID=1675527 RepID=A0A0J9ED51_9RHOB|nr:hypothetical protein [Candidatus Rhodobacter lobularis]KMW59649.1 hypothetical protein AIOL_004631 [Candidatus Rhodobacter lobularis]